MAWPSWFGVLGICASCSFQGPIQDECQTNRQCGASFGLGSICAAEGLCSDQQIHERCTESFPSDLFTNPAEHRDTIVFGSLFDLDNPTQRARKDAIRLALAQIDLEGGVEGRRLGLVSCNTAPAAGSETDSTLEGALEGARYLAETLEVPAILGPASSSDVGSVFQQVRDRGVFVISPSATSPALTDADETSPTDERPGLLWRTAPPDSIQGARIAQDMVARNITNVSVISQSGAYGEGLRDVFEQSFSSGFDLFVFSNANQLSEAITLAGNGSAQEVLFIASAQDDVVTFLNAAATNAGFNSKTLFLTDTAATRDTVDRGPSQLFPKIRGTRPRPLDTRDTVYGTFVASYVAEYQSNVTEFSFTSHAYDMTWITALGAAWAVLRGEEPSGLNIARGARRLSAGEEIILTPSRWNAALQQFRAGAGIDIRGASGTLDYSLVNEETSGPIDVWVIDSTTPEPRIVATSP